MDDNNSNSNKLDEEIYESELEDLPLSLDFSEIDENEKKLLNFIQAVKDDNISFIEEIYIATPNYIFEKDLEGIYPIHYAVIFGNIKIIDFFISKEVALDVKLEGNPLLHLSLSFAVFSKFRKKSVECFSHLYLIMKKYKTELDRLGRTIMHLIVQYDTYECLDIIDFQISDLFIKDFNGETIYDYICIYNSKSCFISIIQKFGLEQILNEFQSQNINYLDKIILYNSVDLISILLKQVTMNNLNEKLINDFHFLKENTSYFLSESMNNLYNIIISYLNNSFLKEDTTDDYFEISSSYHRSALIYHKTCYDHCNINTNAITRIRRRIIQVENPDRISILLVPPYGIFHSDFFSERFIFKESSKPASLADILLVHDFNYVDSIKKLCDELYQTNPYGMIKYDNDTYLSASSYDAALQAAGCVIDAVDLVMKGEVLNAFVAVRPPGHHAGYYGRVETVDKHFHSSNGFCFFNNIAIGAAYCKYKYREHINKIAIIDFDVHHGNGTEEIVRNLIKKTYSISNKNKFCETTINTTICKPWLNEYDAENILFISIHGYDDEEPGNFYPSSGKYSDNTSKESKIYPGGIFNIPINGSLKFSHGYRNVFRARVTPRLIKFKPDIIFISAGFDGHENEEINSSYMKLNEHDFRWMTEELVRIASNFSNSRVISVLEGGYNINSGLLSSFSQSVMTHAKFLNIAVNKCKENLTNCKLIRKREFLQDFENYKRAKKFKVESMETIESCKKRLRERIKKDSFNEDNCNQYENNFDLNNLKYDNTDVEAEFLNLARTEEIDNNKDDKDDKNDTIDKYFISDMMHEEEIDFELNDDEVNMI